MMTDLFDSLSTFIGVARPASCSTSEGRPRNLRKGLVVDALATLGAGLFGSSPGTAYVESIAGIRMGGRTGLTAMVTGLCFLPCLFIAPLAGAIPPYATAAVLIMVGVAMFQSVTQIAFDRVEVGVPAFATLDADPAHLLDHARYAVGVCSSRGPARAGGPRPRGQRHGMGAGHRVDRPSRAGARRDERIPDSRSRHRRAAENQETRRQVDRATGRLAVVAQDRSARQIRWPS